MRGPLTRGPLKIPMKVSVPNLPSNAFGGSRVARSIAIATGVVT